MVQQFLLLACVLAWLCCCVTSSFALEPGFKQSFRAALKDIAAKKPAYVKGEASDVKKGLDCSGYIYLAAKWAGIPGLGRTTAARMAEGLNGWLGSQVLLMQATDCDLPFWTWKTNPLRVNGHVGAFLTGEPKEKQGRDGLSIAHASPRGVVIVPFRYTFVDDLSLIRRLSIGGY